MTQDTGYCIPNNKGEANLGGPRKTTSAFLALGTAPGQEYHLKGQLLYERQSEYANSEHDWTVLTLFLRYINQARMIWDDIFTYLCHSFNTLISWEIAQPQNDLVIDRSFGHIW